MATHDQSNSRPLPAPVSVAEFLAARQAFDDERSMLADKFPPDSPLAGVVMALQLHSHGFNDAQTIRRIKNLIGFPDPSAALAYGEIADSYYRVRPLRIGTST